MVNATVNTDLTAVGATLTDVEAKLKTCRAAMAAGGGQAVDSIASALLSLETDLNTAVKQVAQAVTDNV